MKICTILQVSALWLLATVPLFGQSSGNCFLEDFESKSAVIPSYILEGKTSATPTVTVTFSALDTLGKISKYMFGNAFPSWLGNVATDPVLLKHIQDLSPTFIRYPGGSWSDIFFWDGTAVNVPDSLIDGSTGNKVAFTPSLGTGSWPTTVDNYYDLCSQVGCSGLITINYAYARYSTSEDPVAQAAQYAANWVGYDGGRTKFWEIGNENAGFWEAGWKIDTTQNKDKQPQIITGELYGKHFKIFAKAMKEAAAEFGNTIYIGGQILHYDGSYDADIANRTWNKGFFQEVGDSADFYIMHNYFGNNNSTLKGQVNAALSTIDQNISFIRQDITNKQASSKPIAITEWNCNGPDLAKTSIANGMQAVVLYCESMKNNFGMSCRWPLVNWEADGMFYKGNNTAIPAWTPRPDFFYIYYLEKYFGDHIVITRVTGSSDDILAYASTFSSGHVGIVVVNKGTTDQTVKLIPGNYGYGNQYYIYSLTGGSDNGEFSQQVYVNGNGPKVATGGPIDTLAAIQAWGYSIGDEMRFASPARSVQFVLIEPGTNTAVRGDKNSEIVREFKLYQNYPNPFNPTTTIEYQIPLRQEIKQGGQASPFSEKGERGGFVSLKVYDILGREVTTLVNEVKQTGNYKVTWDASNLPSGVYLVRMSYTSASENMITLSRKMLLVK